MDHDRQHHNVTLAILTLATTAFALMQTMVVPALPVFERELHTSETWATWVLTVFLLVASVATPLMGKLGDQYGKERLLTISLAVFFVGCVVCAAAPNIWVLIVGRAISGVSGGTFPLSFGIIRDEFPREKLPLAIGLVSAVFGVGGGLGIVLSGVLVDNLSWRWLFIVGSIAIAIAVWLTHTFVPESPIKTPSKVDVKGALTLSAGLIALLLALTEGTSWGWTSPRVAALFVLGAALLVLWGWIETKVPEPMVDMKMLGYRPVLLTNICALISGFAMFGVFVLVPNFVETPSSLGYGFGASATKAGLFLLPGSFVLLFAGPLAGIIGKRVGMKWPLSIGLLVAGLAIGGMAIWHDHPYDILITQGLMGLGVGFSFSSMAVLITQSVRQSETGVATGMNTIMRTIGGVIGGQMGAALLTSYTLKNGLPAVTGYTIAFAAAASAALVGAVVALGVTTRARPREERTGVEDTLPATLGVPAQAARRG